ncbi:MAG TPA: hypothetical protein VIX89_08445 [Bryobacteraceae bacterium]
MKKIWSAQILLALISAAAGQQAPLAMPSWLTPYPGANAATLASSASLIETSYTISAKPGDVVAHYRRLFEEAGLKFNSNFDGAGTSIRVAAAECDLLIRVREESAGTIARVSCAAKSAGPLSGADVVVTNGSGSAPFNRPMDAQRFRAEQRQRMADNRAALDKHIANNKIGKFDEQVWPHAPENDAPPLIWPAWLVQIKGGRLNPEQGVDQSRKKYLQSKFVSGAPMTAIYNFYEDLLNANGYRVYSSKLGTGQTIDGIIQNSDGYVEGAHHPYDITGPRTVIRVTFSRFHLNDPIDVRISVTAHPRF